MHCIDKDKLELMKTYALKSDHGILRIERFI